MCKFTPLEFETVRSANDNGNDKGVNLLRWSLKRLPAFEWRDQILMCKFTPLEFETGVLCRFGSILPSVNFYSIGASRRVE